MPNLVHGVLRQGRDIKILQDTARLGGGGQEGRAALDRPRKHDLSWRLADALCDGRDDGIVEDSRLHGMSERCKRQQDDPVLPAKLEQLPFREIWMRFD